MASDVVVVVGVGGMGGPLARRLGPGRTVLLADFSAELLTATAEALAGEGHAVETQQLDVSDAASVAALAAAADGLGPVRTLVHTAGVSPVQAPADRVMAVDLLGAALVLDAFGEVMAPGGAGVVISSMSHIAPQLGHCVRFTFTCFAPLLEGLPLRFFGVAIILMIRKFLSYIMLKFKSSDWLVLGSTGSSLVSKMRPRRSLPIDCSTMA